MLLTKFGADINAQDYVYDTPLNTATLGGHSDVVEALISEFGCSVNTTGYDACGNGHLELAESLFYSTTYLQRYKKNTSLSCVFGHLAVTTMLLIECGADIR